MTKIKAIYLPPTILCLTIIALHIFAVIIPGTLNSFGIQPRSISGLSGVIFSPFIHSGFSHLLSNIIPLFIMGCLISTLNPKLFFLRTILMIVLSGIFTWLISSADIIIGASGLTFAYWAFLITHGIMQKTLLSITISLFTILIYGTLLFSLFKYMPGISWTGHISGVITGIIIACLSQRYFTTNKT